MLYSLPENIHINIALVHTPFFRQTHMKGILSALRYHQPTTREQAQGAWSSRPLLDLLVIIRPSKIAILERKTVFRYTHPDHIVGCLIIYHVYI